MRTFSLFGYELSFCLKKADKHKLQFDNSKLTIVGSEEDMRHGVPLSNFTHIQAFYKYIQKTAGEEKLKGADSEIRIRIRDYTDQSKSLLELRISSFDLGHFDRYQRH